MFLLNIHENCPDGKVWREKGEMKSAKPKLTQPDIYQSRPGVELGKGEGD